MAGFRLGPVIFMDGMVCPFPTCTHACVLERVWLFLGPCEGVVCLEHLYLAFCVFSAYDQLKLGCNGVSCDGRVEQRPDRVDRFYCNFQVKHRVQLLPAGR